MSEDSDLERTEPASQRRLEKARDEGQVPRSTELSTFVALIAAGSGLWLMGGNLGRQLANLMKDGMKVPPEIGFNSGLLTGRMFDQFLHALFALSPFLILMFLVALLAPMLLSGWLFTWKSLTPHFKRLNPLKGLARMFSLNSLVELVKALLKATLIGAMAIWTVWHQKEAVLSLISAPLAASASHIGELIVMSFLAIARTMVLIAGVDVPFKLWDNYRKLKMTKEELRQRCVVRDGADKLALKCLLLSSQSGSSNATTTTVGAR